MKTILCYGDSNTWGHDAGTGKRFPPHVRWPGVLGGELGGGYAVVEEGLCGRTTVWDDPIEGYKNGKDYLVPCLHTHEPLDMVVIMLGTNDLKKRFSLSAFDIAEGAGVLVETVYRELGRNSPSSPKVLLVSPIRIGDTIAESGFYEMFNREEGRKHSLSFSVQFERVALEKGCLFLDAARYAAADSRDAIHLDAPGHAALGKAIARIVIENVSEAAAEK